MPVAVSYRGVWRVGRRKKVRKKWGKEQSNDREKERPKKERNGEGRGKGEEERGKRGEGKGRCVAVTSFDKR